MASVCLEHGVERVFTNGHFRCPQHRKASNARHFASPKYRTTKARYEASPKGKELRTASRARYGASPKGKAREARARASPKGKAREARYEAAPKRNRWRLLVNQPKRNARSLESQGNRLGDIFSATNEVLNG